MDEAASEFLARFSTLPRATFLATASAPGPGVNATLSAAQGAALANVTDQGWEWLQGYVGALAAGFGTDAFDATPEPVRAYVAGLAQVRSPLFWGPAAGRREQGGGVCNRGACTCAVRLEQQLCGCTPVGVPTHPATHPANRTPCPQAGMMQWVTAATPTPATPEKAIVFQSFLPAAVRTLLGGIMAAFTPMGLSGAPLAQAAIQQWADCSVLVRWGQGVGQQASEECSRAALRCDSACCVARQPLQRLLVHRPPASATALRRHCTRPLCTCCCTPAGRRRAA